MTQPDNPRAVLGEEWRVISEAPDYAVSSHGRIKRIVDGRTRKAGTIMKPTPRRAGSYLGIGLNVRGRHVTRFVHRLVCIAFHGPRPSDDHQVAHADGNHTNNHFGNLRWATAIENAADKRRHGRILAGDSHPARQGKQVILSGDDHWSKRRPSQIIKGERIGTSKLTEDDVRAIIDEPQYHGVTIRLSERFGVSNALIGRIRRGLQWKHVSQETTNV